jgi:predicted O-methyltransferase YrrM
MSSYTNKDLNTGDVIDSLVYALNPSNILEVGILNGYSLQHFTNSASSTCRIQAYDIFDDFNGNHANKEDLLSMFKDHKNVSIEYGDFYKIHETIEDKLDIIHIDVANNGGVYEYAMDNYFNKLTDNGIMLLEGGSIDRDEVEWMNKYEKPKIHPVVKKYNMKVIGSFPSITIIRNNK